MHSVHADQIFKVFLLKLCENMFAGQTKIKIILFLAKFTNVY